MKKYFRIITACVLAICLILGTSAMLGVFADPLDGIAVAEGSQNLLTNGSFENSDTLEAVASSEDSTALTEGWSVSSVTNVNFKLSDDANDGKKSLSVTHSTDGSFILRPSSADNNGIIAGFESGVYCLSLYAKGSGSLTLRYKDAAVKELTEKTITLTDDWQTLSVDTLVIGASGKVRFEVYSAADSGEILIDNASLTKYTGLQNGDFESDTGYTVPQAAYDFGSNQKYNYISNGNLLDNSGFEASAVTVNSSGKSWNDAVITEGWATSYSATNFKYSITDDTHSGKHALKVDMPAGSDDTRLFANKNLITDTALAGRMTGLEAGKTYIVSYWIKGTAKSRIFWKTLKSDGTDGGTNMRDPWVQSAEWTLITDEVTAYAVGSDGQAWWNINIGRIADSASELYIDDVSMQTEAQAIASVEAMIDSLNIKSAYAVQAISDIEQWAAVLGKSNISNYSEFEAKVYGKTDSDTTPEQGTEADVTANRYFANGNLYTNWGFEASTEAIQTGKDTTEFTTGWTVSSGLTAGNAKPEIVSDSHSGKNALKLTSAKATSPRIFNTFADAATSHTIWNKESSNADKRDELNNIMSLENGDYIISYWTKGDVQMRVYSKLYNEDYTYDNVTYEQWQNNWGDKLPANTADLPISDWTLYTQKVTVKNGKLWSNVYSIFTAKDQVTYIDDVQLQTTAQAIANVEAMITDLDANADGYERAKKDIEQWVAVLGSENISNYDVFTAKTSIGANKVLENGGFEDSDECVKNLPKDSSYETKITDGWTTNYSGQGNITYSISDDAHSGSNALSVKLSSSVSDSRLHNYYNLATADVKDGQTVTLKAGNMTGLDKDTTYTLSFWAKGDSTVRAWIRKPKDGGVSGYDTVTGKDYNITLNSDKWTLVSASFEPNSSGQIWWCIYLLEASSTTTLIDDVCLQTKEEAIADVEAMIKAFNPTSANAAKTAADIEQWVTALGSDNISNYDEFVKKSSQISNSGFELSDSASLNKGDYTAITTGWVTNHIPSSPKYSVQIVKDAYSGNNALKVTVEAVDKESGFRVINAAANGDKTDSIYDGVISDYEPNTDYLVSYWVKGTADTKVFGKTYNTSKAAWDNNWQKPNFAATGDTWALNSHVIKTDADGNAWWNVFVVGDTVDKTAYIDDIACIPVSEAIVNVEAMISAFDYTTATEADIYEIEQWMKAVTVSDTAKADFEKKLADYNALQAELSWDSIDGVYGWETNESDKITLNTADVAYNTKALKINAENAVSLRPAQVPFGMQDGYYMLVFWAKGGGEVTVNAMAEGASDEKAVITTTESLTSNWKKYVIKDIDISENYSLSSLSFSFSGSSEIYFDAVQMYRQIGPGSQLDDITVSASDDALTLGAAPDGYYTELYKISDKDILAATGEITAPQYNTDVEYRFKIININDDTDVAMSDVLTLSVTGTDGEEETDDTAKKTVKTLTDKATGVSVTAKMSDAAKLTVKVLGEDSDYYDTLLNYGNECIAQYNIFTIPQTAYEGERTFTFTVGKEYNGETLIVTRYDKETRQLEEFTAKVTDGKLTVVASNDGAFMIQKAPEAVVVTPNKPNDTTDNSNNILNGDSDIQPEEEPDNSDAVIENNKADDDTNSPNKQVIVKKSGNGKLIWIIIIIGLGLLLLLILFMFILLLLRKRKNEEEEPEEPLTEQSEE